MDEDAKIAKTFRLSARVVRLIEELAAERDLSQTVVVERAVHEYARRAALIEDEQPLMNSREVAELLGIGRQDVNEPARQGRLPAYKVGARRQYFRRADVEKVLQRIR